MAQKQRIGSTNKKNFQCIWEALFNLRTNVELVVLHICSRQFFRLKSKHYLNASLITAMSLRSTYIETWREGREKERKGWMDGRSKRKFGHQLRLPTLLSSSTLYCCRLFSLLFTSVLLSSLIFNSCVEPYLSFLLGTQRASINLWPQLVIIHAILKANLHQCILGFI